MRCCLFTEGDSGRGSDETPAAWAPGLVGVKPTSCGPGAGRSFLCKPSRCSETERTGELLGHLCMKQESQVEIKGHFVFRQNKAQKVRIHTGEVNTEHLKTCRGAHFGARTKEAETAQWREPCCKETPAAVCRGKPGAGTNRRLAQARGQGRAETRPERHREMQRPVCFVGQASGLADELDVGVRGKEGQG